MGKLNIKHIDFLNIDVEGSDYKVISSLNLNDIRPKMICIEENKYNILVFWILTKWIWKPKIDKFGRLKKNKIHKITAEKN